MLRRRLMQRDNGDGRFMIGNYEVVDLGLSNGLFFATCNVGAKEESQPGEYYMYGKGSQTYDSSASIYNGVEKTLTPNTDTATKVMGSRWRMPTKDELQILINETDYSWTTINGQNGCKLTSKTNPNAYVFFPAAGYRSTSGLHGYDNDGGVWSSTCPGLISSERAFSFGFSDYGNNPGVQLELRKFGLPIRGVHMGGVN